MFGLIKIVTAAVGLLSLVPAVHASGLFESKSYSGLQRRQGVAGTGCFEVDVALLDIVLAADVCVCLEAGALTPEGVANINTAISTNIGLLSPAQQLLIGPTLASIQLFSRNEILSALVDEPSSCAYPAGSTPVCGLACAFTCDEAGFVPCGRQCIQETQGCVSDVPVTRRGLQARNGKFMCPVASEMACLIPALAQKGEKELKSRNYECLSIQNDLESCGGCIVPLAGQPTGQDCTSIPNAASVACQEGACVVHACIRGFTLNGTGECEPTVKPQGFWDAVKDASRIAVNA